MPPRMRQLLALAAKAFREGTDPFNHTFLVENQVTATECVELEYCLAAIIDWYLLNSR